MSSGPSLRARAVLAIVLLVLFYVLSLGIVGFLAWVPFSTQKGFELRLALGSWIGAGIVFWSILPRLQRDEQPGPRLEREENPRLFDELDKVARDSGQPLPADVFLVSEVNAFVTQSGGWMGFGGRRVLGIGLGLMAAFDVSELRSVIAHEFGHFTGGDTRLGPWVYATRAALERTLANLERGQRSVQIVLVQNILWISRMPFRGFYAGFMRITSAVARSQELSADRLAARVSGTTAAVSALTKVERSAAAFEAYLESEYRPILRNGFRAPLTTGFHQFLASESIRRWLADRQAEEHSGKPRTPYDTHPPIAERIRALSEESVAVDLPVESVCSLSLLGDVEACERAILVFRNGEAVERQLVAVDWKDVPVRVLVPSWQRFCAKHADGLAGLSFGELPRALRDREGLQARLRLSEGQDSWGEAMGLVARAMALALTQSGWEPRTAPGDALELVRDGHRLVPFARVSELADPGIPAGEWASWCSAAGVGELRLWPAPPPA